MVRLRDVGNADLVTPGNAISRLGTQNGNGAAAKKDQACMARGIQVKGVAGCKAVSGVAARRE
jgi:hypothetical protein